MSVRRFIAIHEAGHAVVALKLGKDVSELRIEPEGGWCTSHFPSRKRSWHACSSLGGVYAARIHCRGMDRYEEFTSWVYCHEDLRLFNEHRGGMTFRQARRITLQVLREHEALLLALADILERDGYVDTTNAPPELL